MKQFRVFLLTSIITISPFGTVIYTSCKKDPCKGVTCQNGGACNNGSCSCPTGYSGTYCQNSMITFTNDAYTVINITVNGSSTTINPGSSVSFIGGAGSTATVSASTSGTTTTGSQVGDLISWSFTDNFPTDGDLLTEPLDVSSSYFYLYVINRDPSVPITSIQVNSEPVDNVTIPNDANTYAIGYYLALSGNAITATFATGGTYSSVTWNPSIPYISNATVTVTAN
jgi:hypothetical protein